MYITILVAEFVFVLRTSVTSKVIFYYISGVYAFKVRFFLLTIAPSYSFVTIHQSRSILVTFFVCPSNVFSRNKDNYATVSLREKEEKPSDNDVVENSEYDTESGEKPQPLRDNERGPR